MNTGIQNIKVMNNTDVNKILRAGFRLIRSDKHSLIIKVQSKGEYCHGWKTLEKGFKTFREVEARMKILLEDERTIEF